MDDGDSHPASANLNRKTNLDMKHNLLWFSPAGYAFLCFSGGSIPGTRGLIQPTHLVKTSKGVHKFWRSYCK